MPYPVIMPQLGESVDEGTITSWLKNIGDQVEEHEALVEINTDKVDAEVISPAAGVLLEIIIPEGQTIQAGTILAVIGQPGEDPSTISSAAALPPSQSSPSPTAPDGTGTSSVPISAPVSSPNVVHAHKMGRDPELGFISPLVAHIAAEHHVDLTQVQPTGLAGRITKDDVLQHIQNRPDSLHTAGTPTVPSALSEVEILPLSPVRKRIAEHMVLSERTSPHVTTVMEADLSRVIAHRQAHKDAFAASGINLTFTAYFSTAAVAALKEYRLVNASWSDQGIVVHNRINLGIAVALEEGLIVPVIKQAGDLNLHGIARAVNDLAARARTRQLNPAEVQGGTFTITNHGVTGSLFATPIINQPQCAILGVGAIQKRPVVVESDGQDAFAIRSMVYLSLTFDHRILDGAVADQFLAKVVQSLQTWE